MVNIIEIKTVQSAAFRVLIEALKEMLTMKNDNKSNDQSKVDSSRFAMLDNEIQNLQKNSSKGVLRN